MVGSYWGHSLSLQRTHKMSSHFSHWKSKFHWKAWRKLGRKPKNRDYHFIFGCSAIPSFQHALVGIGLSHSMPFARGERSHSGNFVFSVSILLKNPYNSSSFDTEKNPKKNRINQYWQEHAESKVLLINQKWSDSLDSLAFCLVFFELFNEFLIFNEKGLEYYVLLHIPQSDKPCHLHLKRCHTWPNFCFQSLFYVLNNSL